jgi:hypothetical protein
MNGIPILFDCDRFTSAVKRDRRLASARREFGGEEVASMHDDVRVAIMSAEGFSQIEVGER